MYKYVHIYVFKYNSPYTIQDVCFFWILDFYVRLPGREMTIFTQKPDDNANLSEPI